MREMEIDWQAICNYVTGQGWDITKQENPHMLKRPQTEWPPYLQELVNDQIKDGAKLEDIKYPVITADRELTCAAGSKHFFTLTIYSDGLTEIVTIVALADVDRLPEMLGYIDETIADHEEE